MANTKRAADPCFERAVYFASREVARRLAWLLSIVAAVAALGGRAIPATSVATGARVGVMGAGVGALAGEGERPSLRAVARGIALGRRSR
jgi:predicted Rossmann-fold nucleotide-binding protein